MHEILSLWLTSQSIQIKEMKNVQPTNISKEKTKNDEQLYYEGIKKLLQIAKNHNKFDNNTSVWKFIMYNLLQTNDNIIQTNYKREQ